MVKKIKRSAVYVQDLTNEKKNEVKRKAYITKAKKDWSKIAAESEQLEITYSDSEITNGIKVEVSAYVVHQDDMAFIANIIKRTIYEGKITSHIENARLRKIFENHKQSEQ
jgi:hypothetical protein